MNSLSKQGLYNFFDNETINGETCLDVDEKKLKDFLAALPKLRG